MTCAAAQPFTLVQISDTHLLPTLDDRLRGVATGRSLQAVLNQVAAVQPDGLLLTGDLAEAGETSAYRHLVDLISPLAIPAWCLPGNHDSQIEMITILAEPPFQPAPQPLAVGKVGAWRLVTLDSTWSQSRYGEGHLSEAVLDKLMRILAEDDRPTCLALHHHPLLTGIDWIDQIGLTNAAEFSHAIVPFPQVQLVLFGHIHFAFYQWRRGVHYYSCPSTGSQVRPPQVAPADPTWQYPGFRIIRLHPDGSYQTEVRRVFC